MLYWSVVFLIMSLAFTFLGFSGVAGTASGTAIILFFVFLILGVLSLVFSRRVPM